MNKQRKLAYQAIKEIGEEHHGAQASLLRNLGYTRQAYHQWDHHVPSLHEQTEARLKERIIYHYQEHRQRIGATKISYYLAHDETIDFPVSIRRVKRLMTEMHLKCQSRIKRRNHVKQAEQELRDNVLNQDFKVTERNQVWLSDTTEVRYGVNGAYKARLCGVLDLYGRYLLAYNISTTETSGAMIQAFQSAFVSEGNVHPLVHTDRGAAFTSRSFNQFMSQHGVIRSMSRPGTPYDNSPMERWWNEFKLNWLEGHPMPKTLKELKALIEEGIYYFNYIDRTGQRNGLTASEYRGEAI